MIILWNVLTPIRFLGSHLLALLQHQPEIRAPLAVGLGALGGALCRYYLVGSVIRWVGAEFPIGTLMVNLSGCLIMGWFAALAFHRSDLISPDLRLLVAVGYLGSLTTFSSYALDTVGLIHQARWGWVLIYGVGSPVLGLIALFLGQWLARQMI